MPESAPSPATLSWQQQAAIEILGAVEIALKFQTDSQIKALTILEGANVETALKFECWQQTKALKLLGKRKAELALHFKTTEQLVILESMAIDNPELVAKLHTIEQLEALQFLEIDFADPLAHEYIRIAFEVSGAPACPETLLVGIPWF